MAQIVINEISQNYSYNIGTTSYATVAMPITAMWGPCYGDPESIVGDSGTVDDVLEQTSFQHFTATQSGLEAFTSTYRGPASNYRLAKDYSYQMAVTLLTAGYDVLVCRVCPGAKASKTVDAYAPSGTKPHITFTAKYPGTFGNRLKISLTKASNGKYWNLITYVVDASGVTTAVENLIFVFDANAATDIIPHVSEVESDFIDISTDISVDTHAFDSNGSTTVVQQLSGGSDTMTSDSTASTAWESAKTLAETRYKSAGYTETSSCKYISAFDTAPTDSLVANTQKYKEWIYNAAYTVYDLLQDKLNYNPNRIISPGWDDQNICELTNSSESVQLTEVSPLHKKIMETAFTSRCATGFIDIPKSESRQYVSNDDSKKLGYAQMLSKVGTDVLTTDANAALYASHSALFAPWGSYKYVGASKAFTASPSFLALMLQRAMILNQSLQYEWALPTNRKHNLTVGKMDYKVSKHFLDIWQKLDGVSLNAITEIPELGLNVWGNSTLYDVLPATYQALANLSTRFLVNAVEDVVYKCGIAITFQYNNQQAYDKFYAGVTPTLDTMKNVGAIEDYYVTMAADINGLDQVNANTVIGKIYLVVNGVVNDIKVDLIALPPGSDLNQYKS